MKDVSCKCLKALCARSQNLHRSGRTRFRLAARLAILSLVCALLAAIAPAPSSSSPSPGRLHAVLASTSWDINATACGTVSTCVAESMRSTGTWTCT